MSILDDCKSWLTIARLSYLRSLAVPYDPQTRAVGAIAPSGALETAEIIRLIGGNFETGALQANIWSTAVVGSGTVTAVTGEAVASTGTTANSEARFQTNKRARFVTATFNKAHMAIQNEGYSNPDVLRKWGMFDPVDPVISGDGVFFQNNAGNMELVRRKAGANVLTVGESDFNGDIVPGTKVEDNIKIIKDEKVHIYEIVYNAGSALFFQDRRLVHRMTFVDAVGYETVHLRLGAEVMNINGNTTNNTLKTRGFSCSRVGTSAAQPDFFPVRGSGTGLLKNSPGTFRSVIITKTGTAGADITLYDAIVPGTLADQIAEVDLTDSNIALPMGFDFSFGLSYIATGANFEVLLVFD